MMIMGISDLLVLKLKKKHCEISTKVDQFHVGLNQLLNSGMCMSSIFNYDGQEI